jgi:hypothetical protein
MYDMGVVNKLPSRRVTGRGRVPNLFGDSSMSKLHLSSVESNPTTDEQHSDAYLPIGGLLPGYDQWTRFADGEIDAEELDHRWAAEQEENDRLIASQVGQMSGDELCETLRSPKVPEEIKAAARVEAVRRINELLSATTRKSA